ncbi:MAG: CBS domain-containing protein [Candidatus Aenigmarchaeota archaeon]|nr:CBS domain-containing protein [Candidatus Aenigmarchaeota archaeon]MDW8149248.1 CBS domain-containing protein [Candidatus Aenigmarchaeota archaeon]
MVKVKEVMNKDVVKLQHLSTLEKCYRLLEEKRVPSIAVLKKNKLIGQIEREDILKFVKKKNLESINENDIKKLKKNRVFKIKKKCETVYENEDIEIAIRKMNENNLSRLFVTDEKGNLVGVFSRSDILKLKRKGEVYTTIDYMLEVIREKKRISLRNLSKTLNLPEDLIESWAKALEETGEIEIEYPVMSSPIVKSKINIAKN